jgi:hypothetical protein
MKMAEYDREVRARRVSSYMIGRLITTIASVTEFRNQPPRFEVFQFDLFSYAKSNKFKYADCREAVELTTQLLFAFEPFGYQVALKVLEQLLEDMMDDRTPSTIQMNVMNIIRATGIQQDRGHLLHCVSNFTTHFISEEEGISYL